MAEGKTSFMFYCDWKETFESLPDEKAGELIKHILRYVNDENPTSDDILIKAVFANIKAALKRDLKKWERIRDRNRENGALGGRPVKTQQNPKNPVGLSETQKNPEKPDKDKVSVNDNDKDNVSLKREREKRFAPPTLEMVYEYFQEKKLPMGQSRKEAEKYIAYYESNGWKVGKNKMQKWKAAASGWINRLPDFEK